MDIKLLSNFMKVVELGSINLAAYELNISQSTLSQQITRLEGELSTRLFNRSPLGVQPTESGIAFITEIQLVLRHLEQAKFAAKSARLHGKFSLGLAPTTSAIIGIPFLVKMSERYPSVKIHIVESLSGYLSNMLNSRQLDIAILFDQRIDSRLHKRWEIQHIVDEDMYFISAKNSSFTHELDFVKLENLIKIPLILPSGPHGLRTILDENFKRLNFKPNIICEIDALNLLMDAVLLGIGGTIQPWSILNRIENFSDKFICFKVLEPQFIRHNYICSLSDDEMSPPALAARVVLNECIKELVNKGNWIGARLIEKS